MLMLDEEVLNTRIYAKRNIIHTVYFLLIVTQTFIKVWRGKI